MNARSLDMEKAKAWIAAEARHMGFDALGIARAEAAPLAGGRLAAFLADGRHGDMAWLAETAARRKSPKALWPEVKSVIMLGLNYGPDENPLGLLARRDRAAISVYARNRDYHDLIKGRLKQLGQRLLSRFGDADADIKVFVDTAPVMEKPLAAAAGLGWQGKHTNMVSRDFGSWLFLGAIFTTLDLAGGDAHADHCGACRRCLDICPTDAFPAPYQLDARRCISYLSIEYAGHIPLEFRRAMGNRVYGCDDCLAVCPWNKFAQLAKEGALHARAELKAPRLEDLAALDDAGFRRMFSGSPVKRIGRDRFLRNVLIAIGNAGDRQLIPAAEARLNDTSPLVRAMAVWALSQLLAAHEFADLRGRYFAAEDDPDVRAEYEAGMIY